MTPLHAAAAAGCSDAVDLLLKAPGVDVNERGPVSAVAPPFSFLRTSPHILPLPCQWGDRPLHMAAALGSGPTVAALLGDPAVDVNAANTSARATPLHKCAAAGHAAVVALLLSHPGVLPNATDGVRGVG